MINHIRTGALTLLLASAIMPAALQAGSAQQSQPRLDYQAPAQPEAAAPLAAAWTLDAADELLRYIDTLGAEGLEPSAYRPERLREAIAAGGPELVSRVASETFLRLTTDLSGGFVRGDGRAGWHMADNAIDGNRQQALLAQASQSGAAQVLDSLLPSHAQYKGLKKALAKTAPEDQARRQLIRANMERWRWMPRSLGERHVIVNVPAFTAALVQDGRVVARHRAVVGARKTPTPQLQARVTAVTFNPWWTVPQSIIREMGGSFGGYQVKKTEGGSLVVRQPPGPRNALGRLKIEMPNEHAIYLHDTPAQALFDRPVRAFSHGCIRTHNVRDFAAALLAPTGEWDRAAIDRSIATGKTSQAALATPIPVYIAYFTAAATNDGEIVTYADVYGRDAPVRQALNRAAGTGEAQASRAP